MVDPAWTRFEDLLRQHPSTSRELGAALGHYDGRIVSEWRRGNMRPAFADLPRISEALGKPATFLAQEMGMVPRANADELLYASERLQDLEREELEYQQRTVARGDQAVARLVGAACRSGRWAVAVWPVVEGPADCRVRVADRLDFRRTDGRTATETDLRSDLGRALDAAHAVPATVGPRWTPRQSDGTDGNDIQRWSIPRITSHRVPAVWAPSTNARYVAVVSLALNAWPSDTAALIARFLGYGLTSTRGLAMDLYGSPRRGGEAVRTRARVHRELLEAPRPRYVWYHYGRRSGKQTLVPEGSWPDTLTCVWLRETDRLLRASLRNRPADEAERLLPDWLRARKELDSGAEQHLHDRIIRIDVGWPRAPDGSELDQQARRNAMFEQALQAAATAVEAMIDRGFVTKKDVADAVDAYSPNHGDESTIQAWITSHRRLHHRQ